MSEVQSLVSLNVRAGRKLNGVNRLMPPRPFGQ
jgi:hypothetical protein